MKRKPRILTPKKEYTIDYPEAVEFAEKQMSVFWEPTEIRTEKDVQDLMVNMTESERHGVITTLKLFTLYEMEIGQEYWGGKVAKNYMRPDIQRMANCFSFFEINVHAPFYNQINEAMMLNTDEFYSSYCDDPTLKSRIDFIEEAAASKNLLYSLGTFSMIEGAVLYSNFAFLKHFQAKGKNKLMNVCRGINFSVRDENLHHLGGCWLFRKTVEEMELTEPELLELHEKIIEAAKHICDHEFRIVEMIFEKGRIEGITELQMKNFVESRINLCLQHLGIGKIYKVDYNPIDDWFYKGINMLQFHDFFTAQGSDYNRSWNETAFVWKQ